MTCPRCGAVSEGNFCPRCGAPMAPQPPAPALGVRCPRCGTVYQGNFCPRCGLPAGTAAYAPTPVVRSPASGVRSVLSILWTLSLVGFFIFIALNFAGLVLSPAYVAPGIQGIAHGESVNQNLSAGSANWTFVSLGTPATTGTFNATGGSPGGALEMTLPAGTNVGGMWVQSVRLAGSAPWLAEVNVSYRVQAASSLRGRLVVAVESVPTGLNVSDAAALIGVNASTPWSFTGPVDVSGAIAGSGTYYLKVAYLASSNGGSTDMFVNHIRMAWTTDAVFYFYLPVPLPQLLYLIYLSQDPGQFLAYFVFIVGAILAAGAWYSWRDRKLTLRTFTAPLEALGTRLRSMSAWVAVAQVWMATMFFQYALILILAAAGSPPTSPFTETSTNAWVLLFDYSAASVYEELAFRALLIGVPMAVGAFLLRWSQGRGVASANAQGAPRANVLGGLRYLWGGQLRKDSPREAQLAAWILVFASALLFGLAHAPGWGWWKVLPAFVVGLGMGYVFVRHGIGAAILLHFATDGSLALSLEGVGGIGLTVVSDLLFLGLAIAGAGFFAWYVLYGWEKFQDLWARFSSRIVRQPVGTAAGPGLPPPGTGGMGPSSGSAQVSYYVQPAPPTPPTGYAPAPPGWQAPPMAAAPRSVGPLPFGYVPTYHPAPYGYPPVRFQCPSCGWVEAKYENRRFTCLRCGRTA
ncbi:MAG TPA: CPBP family glutamic-type intramembrane protease [Thermoplasmata archaeon]|nr:CPBP family glutamic-type intramembrane protease [Thermoplasmata archaeon]